MFLKDLGEDALIGRIRTRFKDSAIGGPVGIGDDTAVLDWQPGYQILYCSDLVAENTHFIRGVHPADSIGFKAVAVNVSDVGAMGGEPLHFVVSIGLPRDLEVAWVDRFYDGVERACQEFNVSLAGGDSSSADLIFVDVAMIGRVPTGKAVRRSGARAGDGVYLTGTLGASAAGLDLLRRGGVQDCAMSAVLRHLYPQPRHKIGAAIAGLAHAMIDVSDGLSTDLGRVAAESKVTARIYKDRIPVAPEASYQQALHGGEEYELIIVAPDLPDRIEGISLTRIGEIVAPAGEPGVLLVDEVSGPEGRLLVPLGFRHWGE